MSWNSTKETKMKKWRLRCKFRQTNQKERELSKDGRRKIACNSKEILYLLLRMYSLFLCKYKAIFGTFVTWQHFLFRYNRAVFSQRVQIWIVIVKHLCQIFELSILEQMVICDYMYFSKKKNRKYTYIVCREKNIFVYLIICRSSWLSSSISEVTT